jgi:nucleotide-binding universal stress UspA family protein
MIPFRTILVPVDFSGHSSRALDAAIELAKHFGGKLHLIHVYPIQPILVAPYEASLPIDIEKNLREPANLRLREWAERAAQAGVAVETMTAADTPAEAIVRRAEDIGADLIVMGTRGLTGLKHVLLGSVTERTLRTAPCPVLTVKAG